MRDLAGNPIVPSDGSCPVSAKFAYRSRKRALTALGLAAKTGATVRSVYRCRHCSRWHMTSMEQAPRRAGEAS